MTTPTRLLALDVGTGTTDILVFEPERRPENSVKLVVPSRTQVVAGQIREATRRGLPVVFAGPTMGGGPSTKAMLAHLAAGLAFSATQSAALTFADSLAEVSERGVRLVADDEMPAAPARRRRPGAQRRRRPARPAAGAGRPGRADPVHGRLRRGPGPRLQPAAAPTASFASRSGSAPWPPARRSTSCSTPPTRCRPSSPACGRRPPSSRLCRESRPPTPARPLCWEPSATTLADAVLVNVGNCHTICAVALDRRLAGIYEDHTNRLDGPTLEAYVRRFLAGELASDEVRQAGGHGAALGGPVPAGLPVLVTGPHRELLTGSSLPVSFPAPFGDMMMTGPAGLIAAHRRRYGDLRARSRLPRAAAGCRRRRRARVRTPGARSERRGWRCRG